MNRTLPRPAADVALLVARLLLGTIMFAHGYQKLVVSGLGRTTQGFESMSIPLAIVSASFVTVVELVGGVLVLVGALLTVVAACYLVVMVGAAVFVHIPNGIFVADSGWELVGAIAALLLALAAAGSGRFGVDGVVRARRARAAAEAPTEVSRVPVLPDQPPSRPHHGGRASAFTEVFPQVPAEGPAASPPARHPAATHAAPRRSGRWAPPEPAQPREPEVTQAPSTAPGPDPRP